MIKWRLYAMGYSGVCTEVLIPEQKSTGNGSLEKAITEMKGKYQEMLILLKHGWKQSKTNQRSSETPQRYQLTGAVWVEMQIHYPCKHIWKTVQFLKLLWTPTKHNWISKFKDKIEITLKLRPLPLHQCFTGWSLNWALCKRKKFNRNIW